MELKETYYIIATGGEFNDKFIIKKIALSEKDLDGGDPDDFFSYVENVLENEKFEFDQKYSQSIIIQDNQVEALIKALKTKCQ